MTVISFLRQSNYYKTMSFCQNHRNHHCVHAHNCTDHHHKINHPNHSKNRSNRRASNTATGSRNLHKIVEQNEQDIECHFNSNYHDSNSGKKCSSCLKLEAQLSQKDKQLQQKKKEINSIERKYTKMCDENRQLQGVIQYYREEIDRIVKCGQLDLKNEIKRHLKQNTELSARNKFIAAKFNQMSQLLEKITAEAEQKQKKLQQLRKQKEEISVSFKTLLQKLKRKQAEDLSKENDTQNEKKRNSQIEQKYHIVIEEVNRNLESSIRQNKKLFQENKELSKNVQLLKQKLTNNEKLAKIEQQASNQKQIVLKKKIQNLQKQVKQLRQSLSKLELSLKLKQEQLLFSKKVVEKQLKIIKQNKQLFEQVKADVDASHKEKQPSLSENTDYQNKQESRKSEEHINELKNEIKMLRQKIVILEGKGGGHSSETIQQYIMTIGASEAFRKIIDEKNAYIKKLIRQKGALLQRT